MQAILDFFVNLWELVQWVFQWFLGLLEDLAYIHRITWNFLLNIQEYFSFLPSPYITILIALFSIVVVYKVMGREG